MNDRLEMPLEQFVVAVTKENERLRARVAELEEALRQIERATVDDQPTCCARGIRLECCGFPEYGIDRARRIACDVLAKYEENK